MTAANLDAALVFAKINEIFEELRELKSKQMMPNKLLRTEDPALNSLQEKALQVLSPGTEMTAEEMAKALNRTRPLLVINLNQLVALGLVKKIRKGRQVYFSLRSEEPTAPVKETSTGNGCYMVAVLVSEQWPGKIEDAEKLLSEHLQGIPGWKIEHVAILPKVN